MTNQQRERIAAELLNGCPPEGQQDHERIAQMIRDGKSRAAILSAADAWPETYVWLKHRITIGEAAHTLRAIPSACRSEASRANGRKPVKPGSRPRGRPRKQGGKNARS